MAQKTFLISLDLYSQKRTQLCLEDPKDFFSPLVPVVLQENGNDGDQAVDFEKHFDDMGIQYNHLIYGENINESEILEPLLTWTDDENQKNKLLQPAVALFPFAVARMMVIHSDGSSSEEVRIYDTLAEAIADRDIQRNDI